MTKEAMEITWPAPVDMTAKSMSTIMRMIPKVPRNVSATTGKTIPERTKRNSNHSQSVTKKIYFTPASRP